jgi:hypothetical protein
MKILADKDFDGLVSALFLSDEFGVDLQDIEFANAGKIDNGEVHLDPDEEWIIADLPYIPGAKMWFDHHDSNIDGNHDGIEGIRELADSCAGLIAEHYGITKYGDLPEIVDRIDSARYTEDDILNPHGWSLISFIINVNRDYDFYRHLIDLMRVHGDNADKILEDERVGELAASYRIGLGEAIEFVRDNAEIDGRVMIIDYRERPEFRRYKLIEYFLFPDRPECNASIKIYNADGDNDRVLIRVGYSLTNGTCGVHMGDMMKRYGGGGHKKAGGARVHSEDVDRICQEIIEALH